MLHKLSFATIPLCMGLLFGVQAKAKVTPTPVPVKEAQVEKPKQGYFKVLVLYSDDGTSWKELGSNTFFGAELSIEATIDGKKVGKGESK